MTEARMNFMQSILDTFENEDIKEFAIVLLEGLPEYLWQVGASSTGKYHPAYSLGEMGLMRHQVAVVRFINFFLELEQYKTEFASRERDLMRLAGLIHDGRKSGSQEDYEKSKYTKFNHPILMADVVRSYDGEYLNHEEIEMIAEAISKHMGQWCEDKKTRVVLPKPDDNFSKLVHLADYLASRKSLTMEFENYSAQPAVLEFDENYKLNFGKHSGQRLIDVYKHSHDYVEWLEGNIHKQDVLNQIAAMKKHIKDAEEEL